MEALLVMIHTSLLLPLFSYLLFFLCSMRIARYHHLHNRIILTAASGQLGSSSRQGIPYSCFPCVHQQLVRQRIPDLSPPPVLCLALLSQADLGRVHRIPQHRQVLDHQHSSQEEGLQCCSHSWRDQGLAVHHLDEAYLPHRLSWCRSPKHG